MNGVCQVTVMSMKLFILNFKNSIFLFSCLITGPLLSDPIDHAIVSIYAIQCETGKVILSENCDISLVPSSCMKVVTTTTALQLLDPDTRFETYLEQDGWIDEQKTLHGNIYIRGGGDPCLGSDRIAGNPSWKKQIAIWADAIQEYGIQKIQGKIVGDATHWETALAAPGWLWEDLGNYYGAGASALSFHENLYSISFKPGNAVGADVSILRTEPPMTSLTFENEVKTGPEGSGDRACIYGSEYSPVQFLRGTIPLGEKEFSIKGAIPDPAAACADLLTQELQAREIEVLGENLKPQHKKVALHVTYSPSLREIVYWTNQKSINLYAEHLLKKMGEQIHKEGSTAAGIQAVTAFWKAHDIDLSGFNMADGSGLSRKNLITTRQLVEMLHVTKKSHSFPIFFESLPQQEASMRAKSGSMSFNKGFVGYTNNIAFAVLVNHCTNAQALHEKVKSLLLEINKESDLKTQDLQD